MIALCAMKKWTRPTGLWWRLCRRDSQQKSDRQIVFVLAFVSSNAGTIHEITRTERSETSWLRVFSWIAFPGSRFQTGHYVCYLALALADAKADNRASFARNLPGR